jgi:hypothetical protein
LSLQSVVQEIDRRAGSHPIGQLQTIRKELNNLKRIPGGGRIFSQQTTFEDKGYAFHFGGRKELPFNVGFELKLKLRHGVAFSLEPSRTLPDVTRLYPKVDRFNEFLRSHPQEFSDLWMWHSVKDKRSRFNSRPAPILPELSRPPVFIFLGRLQQVDRINYELILRDFDRLLPLYQVVEGHSNYPTTAGGTDPFAFKPGCSVKAAATTASIAERLLDIDLRHNAIQAALHRHLVSLHGIDNVGTERPTGSGGKIDVVVRRGAKYWFYEIKPGISPRACIREALAQLLEYSFWPRAQEAESLIVVGERPLDRESSRYLSRLQREFSLPIIYQQFDLKEGRVLAPKSTNARRGFDSGDDR